MFSIKRSTIKNSTGELSWPILDVRLLLITLFINLYKGKLPNGFTILYNNRILITCTRFFAILPTQPYYRPASNLIVEHVATVLMVVFIITLIIRIIL